MIRKGQPTAESNMNWRKVRGMGTIGALGFLMLFQYQNCAPSNGVASMNSVADGDQIVTTIDDVNLSGVSFSQEKVQLVTDTQPTVVEGECDARQDGKVLGWRVRDGGDNEMERGYSVCEQGRFQVEMAPSAELECDTAYHLTAKLAEGASGHLELERHCGAN